MILVPTLEDAIAHLKNQLAGYEAEANNLLRQINLNDRYKAGERSNETAHQSYRLSNTEYLKDLARANGKAYATRRAIEIIETHRQQALEAFVEKYNKAVTSAHRARKGEAK